MATPGDGVRVFGRWSNIQLLVGGWTNPSENISQIGSFTQVGVKIKNVWNHHVELLVGGFHPFEKILVNLDNFPKDRDEHKKCLKPPPRLYLAKL